MYIVAYSQVVNCGELLSKWVGESTKNIEAIFEEAKHSDASMKLRVCLAPEHQWREYWLDKFLS